MIGGIVGNLADRLRLGWVTDFLDFHVAGYHWPSFNIADAAICVGVGIYILTSWRDVQHHTTENAGATMADTEPHSRNRKCDHGLHG
jgi:lipoprotein signal peptidase